MSTQASKDLILQSSNLGARLFECDRLEEAKCQFHHAFRAIRQLRSIQEMSSPAPENCSSIRGWSMPVQSKEEHIFVFSRVFLFNLPYDPSQSDVYFCAIAFNLGVTYHLLTSRRARSSDFQQASALYEQSMKMVESIGPKQRESSYLHDLRMVILNNAGHVYYTERSNFRAATQCFEAVCAMVEHTAAPATALPETEIDSMLANVLLKLTVAAPLA